ncbi:MAG: hypothetical protein KC549_01925, partial [Myxococcales bacterium]|nr:hypothetical protein [Myxococcales bacterium]
MRVTWLVGVLVLWGCDDGASPTVGADAGAPDMGVVAAGDVARWPNARFGGEPARIEHWDNAIEMAVAAARRLLAAEGASGVPYEPVPWFWSDLYDRKIQLAG